jgi:hypothetical protein
MTLRIIDDIIELDGMPVARLLPRLNATTVYRLVEALDLANDELEDIRDWLNVRDDDEPSPKPKPKPNLVLVSSNPDP